MNNLLTDESFEDERKGTDEEVYTPRESFKIFNFDGNRRSSFPKNFNLKVTKHLSVINSRELTSEDRYKSVFLFRETNNKDFDYLNTFSKLIFKFKNPFIIKHVKAIGYEKVKGTKACMKLKIWLKGEQEKAQNVWHYQFLPALEKVSQTHKDLFLDITKLFRFEKLFEKYRNIQYNHYMIKKNPYCVKKVTAFRESKKNKELIWVSYKRKVFPFERQRREERWCMFLVFNPIATKKVKRYKSFTLRSFESFERE